MGGEPDLGVARMREYFQGLQVVRAVACLIVVFAHLSVLEYHFGLHYLASALLAVAVAALVGAGLTARSLLRRGRGG